MIDSARLFLTPHPVERGIDHLKNWRALVRYLCRREHMSDTVQPSPDCCPTNRART
ncbi:hypothetical protein V1L54_02380 [Streptomyces sp. TRM 70361]|uniref:hypothetical protein n=1 Tax=Streptomyces sp. TRM 70361 TaxID=3116553 RepID=UPI002E7C2C1B|nr:hypothetical protein [Streptomyces sp. TRM 70361]MEE1938269.1 hypothetical protein [Streptomyces sp. TRM 70361]